MPLYDYDCLACGHRVEVMHGVHGTGPAACPSCGSERIRKAFAAPAVHFKGTGWAKKERRATSTPGSGRSAAADGQGGDASGSSGNASDSASDGPSEASVGSSSAAGDTKKDSSSSKDASSPTPAKAASGASTD